MSNNTVKSSSEQKQRERPRRVLVCVTPQSNSRRLIDEGHRISALLDAQMHILHISHGNTVFAGDSPLLAELFDYGSKLGGITHGVCGADIFKTMVIFIKKNKIMHVVMGCSGEDSQFKEDTLSQRIKRRLPNVTVTALKNE